MFYTSIIPDIYGCVYKDGNTLFVTQCQNVEMLQAQITRTYHTADNN